MAESTQEHQQLLDSIDQRYLLIDVGANLTNKRYQRDLDSVLQRAQESGALNWCSSVKSVSDYQYSVLFLCPKTRRAKNCGNWNILASQSRCSSTHSIVSRCYLLYSRYEGILNIKWLKNMNKSKFCSRHSSTRRQIMGPPNILRHTEAVSVGIRVRSNWRMRTWF